MGIVVAITGAVFAAVGLFRVFVPSHEGIDGSVWLVIAAIMLSGAAVCQGLHAIERAIRNEHESKVPARKVGRGVRQPDGGAH